MAKWRDSLAVYRDPRMLAILLLGFSSGLPLALTASTLSLWLAGRGISLKTIGLFALVGAPYTFKFLWSPLLDRLPPPLPLGRRRGWGILLQIGLAAALLGLGLCDPGRDLTLMAGLAVLVAFLSASQDIVVDAYRVEILRDEEQGAGAGATQAGYRFGMLASGAGALIAAQHFGWFAAYALMAGLMVVGIGAFLVFPEPRPGISAATLERERQARRFLDGRPHLGGRRAALLGWLYGAVVCPFADFMTRRRWAAILLCVIGYKLGEALAGVMAMPLYHEMGFTLDEIALASKIFGPIATVAGALVGGGLVARWGTLRALLLCGLIQSAGNLAYVAQARAGHDVAALALCVVAENVTSGMAGAAMIAYLSGLCNPAYTATQYALLSSVAMVGRTLLASTAGHLAERLGWVDFFLLTTVITLPALILLAWMMGTPRRPLGAAPAAEVPAPGPTE